MKLFSSMLVLLAGLLSACTSQQKNDYFTPVADCQLRAPAYPLVTIDPYTSGWSFTDQLNADQTRHWTGKPFPLLGVCGSTEPTIVLWEKRISLCGLY